MFLKREPPFFDGAMSLPALGGSRLPITAYDA
jgi:hypothetical protein